MNELKKFLIFLSLFDYTYTKFQLIVDAMGQEISLKKFCKTKFDEKILSKEQYDSMLEKADENLIKNYYENLRNKDITLLTKYDDKYPENLRNLPDAPFFLFCKGDIELLNSPSLAVVGTRKPTNYGRIVTEKIVGEVAKKKVTIISGLAYGVDSIAHRKTLEVGGKTIAILGSGFNYIYPSEHQALADEIAKKGLLVSEYPPSKKSTKYTFPQRNRIIAGLSDGVLVTEAGIKSGTIHTKEFALEYGKNLYAIPGDINSSMSQLTNDIIKSGQGALVTTGDDILKDYKIKEEKKESFVINVSAEEQIIVNILQSGAKEIDELARESGFDVNILNSYLTTLEISGIISRLPGNFIALI